MNVRLIETQLSVVNSTTRLPFRYGSACMSWCPQAILRARVETNGEVRDGFSGDCLPPSWFDKSPTKDYDQQIAEMKHSIGVASDRFVEHFRRPSGFFDGWWQLQQQLQDDGRTRGWPGLLSGFGVSMIERAVIDAVARALDVSFFRLMRDNLLLVEAERYDRRLAGAVPGDWLPQQPQKSIYVRHTVGLADPLTRSEISADDLLDDGHPQSLEDYLRADSIRYLKIKVSNDHDQDLQRLMAIAKLVESHRGKDYRVTLDGNEQYSCADDFDSLIAGIRQHESLETLWKNTLVIEQPLARDIALSESDTQGVRSLSAEKSVIIDESDESMDCYHRAIDVGYRGVSTKNCKGPLRSILKAGLNWHLNERSKHDEANPGHFTMTGEDLCCVGIVPLQSDLCLVAALGLKHVERNGHHYHRGLSYLPQSQREDALAAHPDLYTMDRGMVWPKVVDGQFQIQSLQCAGFGFAVQPEMTSGDA